MTQRRSRMGASATRARACATTSSRSPAWSRASRRDSSAAETDLVQPIRRDLRRLPVGQISEGLATPQREGLREGVRGTIGLAELEQLSAARHELLEAFGIENDAVRREPISERRRLDARRRDQAAQSHDAARDHLRPRGRQILSPERSRERLDRRSTCRSARRARSAQTITRRERDPASSSVSAPRTPQVHDPLVGLPPIFVKGADIGLIPADSPPISPRGRVVRVSRR